MNYMILSNGDKFRIKYKGGWWPFWRWVYTYSVTAEFRWVRDFGTLKEAEDWIKHDRKFREARAREWGVIKRLDEEIGG